MAKSTIYLLTLTFECKSCVNKSLNRKQQKTAFKNKIYLHRSCCYQNKQNRNTKIRKRLQNLYEKQLNTIFSKAKKSFSRYRKQENIEKKPKKRHKKIKKKKSGTETKIDSLQKLYEKHLKTVVWLLM